MTLSIQNLTVEQIENAMEELPDSIAGRETKRELKNTLDYVKRGFPIKTNAPTWVKACNQIFVSKIEDAGDKETIT